MSTSNLNIFVPPTGTPVHVSSAYASDFQIANNSTNPVWVGGDSSVSVTSGLLLNPGGATTWGGGQDLWAVSASGSSGMVTCLFNASGSYTPGPTTVDIGSIIAPVEVIPQNTTTPLLGLNNAPATTEFNSGSLVGYGTILIKVRGDSSVTPGQAVNLGKLYWLDDGGGVISVEEFVWDSAGSFYLITPVQGKRCDIVFNAYGTNPTHTWLTVIVEGLSAIIPASYTHSYVPNTQNPVTPSTTGTLIGYGGSVYRGGSYADVSQSILGTTARLYIDSSAGPAIVSGQTGAAVTAGLTVVTHPAPTGSGENNIALNQINTSAAGTVFTLPLNLINAPIVVTIAGTTTLSRVQLGIYQ